MNRNGKKAELVSESEHLYRTIFETSGTAMIILGENMLISLINPAFEKLSGYSKEELENKREITEFIAEEELPRMKEYHKVRRIDANSVPANYEFKFLTRSGITRDIYIAVNIIPGTKKSVVSFTDITDRKRVEERLRNSESRYRSLADDMDAIVCAFLPDGTVTYANRMYREYYNFEEPGHKFLDNQRNDAVRKEAMRNYSSLTYDQPKSTYEQQVLLPDGTPKWQRWTNRAIFNDKRELVSYQAVGIDITQRTQIENDLRKSEARWQFALEGAGDGVWEVNLATQEAFYSHRCYEMLGYDEYDIDNLMGEWDKFLHPEDKQQYHEYLEKYYNGEIPIYKNEYRVLCKDGSYKWILDRGKVIERTPEGKPLRMIGTHADISIRKQAEALQKEQHRLLEQVIEFLPDATSVINKHGEVIFWNKAMETMTGITKDKIVGRGNYEYALPFYGERRPVLIDVALLSRSEYGRLKHKYDFIREGISSLTGEIYVPKINDGKGAYLFGAASRLYDASGNIIGAIESIRDITLSKRAENEREDLLRRSQAMFEEHAAIMLLIEPISGKIADANPAACAFYGYNKSELLKMNIQDINLIPQKESERKRLMALQQKQRYFLFPHRLKSGEVRLVDVYSSPVTHNGELMLFSIIFDVSDRERYKEELYWEKELLRTTLLSIGDGVITTDRQGKITSLNKVAELLIGWTQEDACGKSLEKVFKIINETTGERCDNPVLKVLSTGNIAELVDHTVLISKKGIKRSIESIAAPIKDEGDKINGAVLIFRDFTEKKKRLAKIEYLSYHDQLTGLYNRRFLEEELLRMDAESNLPITLVIGDINGLNLTNDAFGHLAGDMLLQRVAAVVKKECRPNDIIARFGGDEFVILLPKTDSEEAAVIIKRINEALLYENESTVPLSISFGWETKVSPVESMTAVFKKAEDFMYRRKLSESASMRNKTVKVIIKTLYEKSEREQKHSARVSQLCQALGVALKLSVEDVSEIRTAGLMHDIGKIILDDRILDKNSPLSDVEFSEFQRHAETGYRILSSVNEFAPLAEYVLAHHERWDGKGYPKGLQGAEIPLQARILAVADAYDAMTSDRPYRKALSNDEALEEIKSNAGTQFDPDIAQVFLEHIEEWNYATRLLYLL